jgi:hypothetical protein
MCVQNFDDSRGLAIRITYRISLRSSSLWEPRHPLLKVVSFSHSQADASPLAFFCCSVRSVDSLDDKTTAFQGGPPEGNPTGQQSSHHLKEVEFSFQATDSHRIGNPSSGMPHMCRRTRHESNTDGCQHEEDSYCGCYPAAVWYPALLLRAGMFAKKILDRCGNDPSAGSPTETLLRLHLPLNDKV